MGSVSCIIVWTCECWAFVRFYNWYPPQSCISTPRYTNIKPISLYRHRDSINTSPSLARLRRFPQGAEDLYPWRSHGQPFTMYLALFGCLFVLLIADGAALWHGFMVPGFLSAYLAVCSSTYPSINVEMLIILNSHSASSSSGSESSSCAGKACGCIWRICQISRRLRRNSGIWMRLGRGLRRGFKMNSRADGGICGA